MRSVKMREQCESERVAKLVVESFVPGATMSYRIDQANGQHDYDLRYASGLVVPLEVTLSADSNIERGAGALKHGRFINVNACHHDWYVHPLPGVLINEPWKNKVDQYLAAIEQEGLDEFFAFRDATRFRSVKRILQDLKIESGSTTVWNPPGRIGIADPSPNMMSLVDSFSAVQRAVESEVQKKSKKKFAFLDAPERHLFVYVHPRNYPVWVALIGSSIPADQPPRCQDGSGITDLWVAAPDRSKNMYVVWRCPAADGWRNLGTITI